MFKVNTDTYKRLQCKTNHDGIWSYISNKVRKFFFENGKSKPDYWKSMEADLKDFFSAHVPSNLLDGNYEVFYEDDGGIRVGIQVKLGYILKYTKDDVRYLQRLYLKGLLNT